MLIFNSRIAGRSGSIGGMWGVGCGRWYVGVGCGRCYVVGGLWEVVCRIRYVEGGTWKMVQYVRGSM